MHDRSVLSSSRIVPVPFDFPMSGPGPCDEDSATPSAPSASIVGSSEQQAEISLDNLSSISVKRLKLFLLYEEVPADRLNRLLERSELEDIARRLLYFRGENLLKNWRSDTVKIFLDVDGVLNRLGGFARQLDRDLCGNFVREVLWLGEPRVSGEDVPPPCQIVLSSSWRKKLLNKATLATFLQEQFGVSKDVFCGETGDIAFDLRALEIERFMEGVVAEGVPGGSSPGGNLWDRDWAKEVVVLDDLDGQGASLMRDKFGTQFVQTDGKRGLDAEAAGLAREAGVRARDALRERIGGAAGGSYGGTGGTTGGSGGGVQAHGGGEGHGSGGNEQAGAGVGVRSAAGQSKF